MDFRRNKTYNHLTFYEFTIWTLDISFPQSMFLGSPNEFPFPHTNLLILWLPRRTTWTFLYEIQSNYKNSLKKTSRVVVYLRDESD